MKKILTFKMPFRTSHFNKGQKVFIEMGTGALAAKCRGKHRGKHRWISAWVNWWPKKKKAPKIKEIEITDKQHAGIYGRKENTK